MSNTYVIVGGTLIDSRPERIEDVLIVDGKIERVEKDISIPKGAHVIDAQDKIVSPGLVDIQVHFREPGQEASEDIQSGSRSAAIGGMTAVQTMPNTNPCIDSVEAYLDAKNRSRDASCDVFVSAAITKNRASEELAPLVELYEAGARTFTDDGDCVKTAQMMRRAIEELSPLENAVLAQHCEDHSLVHEGVMDEGYVSHELGLPGRHRVAEEIIISRDIALMSAFSRKSLRYHVLHLSTRQGLEVVRHAHKLGVNITAEVAPQHLVLTSELLKSGNANFKMNPPLREQADVQALRSGIKDGTITAIATDHAPHPKELKDKGLTSAPPGMLGVETALSVGITHLVHTGVLTIKELVYLLSIKPSRIINAHKLENGGHGLSVQAGNPANIAVFSTDEDWVVNAKDLHSKSENSPWDGQQLKGKVHYTFLQGEMTCEKGQPTK
jgi:dihydroorotase